MDNLIFGRLRFLKKTILIVDDDQSILRSLSRVLEKNGYETDTAETAMKPLIN